MITAPEFLISYPCTILSAVLIVFGITWYAAVPRDRECTAWLLLASLLAIWQIHLLR